MNILNLEHISKIYGDKTIFDDVSCGISEGEKIGIIGINGTGKTTLLRIIAGLEEADEGKMTCQNNKQIVFLPQQPQFPEGETPLSYVAKSHGGDIWTAETEAHTVLNRLGIENHEESLDNLSGGQRKRVALAAALVHQADILILDEPTNHLDNGMVTWLEEYLIAFRGVIIMVTHDRYFLDRVTNRILEISHGKLYSYEAHYTKFLEMKAEREEMEMASERKRKSILRMELEWAKRGCRARTTKQQARLHRLEDLKVSIAPIQDQNVEMESVSSRMGKKTIELQGITKGYDSRTLISDFSTIVLKNQRLGIIGPNGCGKSTLMKILIGEIQPDEGTVEIGETIKIGYFAQEVGDMHTNQRVIDYIRDVAEIIHTKDGVATASQMLERFLFTPDMQYAPVSKLSGGEQRRLYLLKVLMAAPNVLVLDEPTNDLDIPTLTILEDYLEGFAGIVIAVSHDRYFLDNVVDRIYAFEENGHLQQYEGGYSDYVTAYALRHPQTEQESTPEPVVKEKAVKTREKKLKFSYKEEKEFATIDDDIAALEEKLEDIDRLMGQFSRDFVRLNELTKEKEETQEKLDEKMERWVYLNDLAEAIEAQKK